MRNFFNAAGAVRRAVFRNAAARGAGRSSGT